LELERSLLEGEQQTQMEQLRLAEEKINELERKESLLLSEAMQQRAKVLDVQFILCPLWFSSYNY